MLRKLKAGLGVSKGGGGAAEADQGLEEGGRVVAEKVDAAAAAPAAGAGAADLPPRPPGASPFDAPADAGAKAHGGHPCTTLGQSLSGPPALGRPSSLKQYLSREEICASVGPELQDRVSRHLARVSCDPGVVASAKATLRREAAEVHSMPKVSSEELLPQLESVLSFERGGARGSGGAPAEHEALATLGVDPTAAPAAAPLGGDTQLEQRHTA